MECKDKLPLTMVGDWRKIEDRLDDMSPFEIKDKLIDLAYAHTRKSSCQFLNAGRGNPNWIATEPREAFFLLGIFAMNECRRVMDLSEHIAGIPLPEGIAGRFDEFIDRYADHKGAALLKATYDYMTTKKGFKSEELLFEFVEAIIGDQYPMPDRILDFCESISHDFIVQELCDKVEPEVPFDLFATEGGTAAMCYIFNSLKTNFLVSPGDHVALMTPIFTPYIEIPKMDEFRFKVTNINASELDADGLHTWQYPDSEIDKLKNSDIKVLFVVNPSNPPSYAISQHTIDRIARIVAVDNPNLMIITDDVYATYVPHFKSLLAVLPHNTLGVYSFSKYYGATGWRLALIALSRNNIYDQMIKGLTAAEQKILNKRYGSISLEPCKIKFIDRMVADSRMVALNHTAGLSTPQQMQMSLFAAFSVFDRKDVYKKKMHTIIKERHDELWNAMDLKFVKNPLCAGYYSEIDIDIHAEKLYGKEFAEYLKKNYNPLDFVVRLAKDTCVVLLNGSGFEGPLWSIRVSLANLNASDYKQIGHAVRKILEEYAQQWQKDTKQKR